MKRKLSIKDISDAAGVSVATVSRVLNKSGYYSEDMEKRINDVIARTNYMPNFAARALRSNVAPLIGIVFPDANNLHFIQIAFGLQRRLLSEQLLSFVIHESESDTVAGQPYTDLFHAHNYGGIIYIGTNFDDKEEYQSDIPTVFIECEPQKIAADVRYAILKADHMQAGILGTQLLINRGCRNILFLRNRKNIARSSAKEIGYLHALRDNYIQFNEKWLIPIDREMGTSTYEALNELILRGFPFDAVYCNTDIAAMGAMHALTEHHIKVPEQIKILGYTNSSESRHYFPPISTVDMQTEKMISSAADMILQLIHGKTLQEKSLLLPIEIIQRATT